MIESGSKIRNPCNKLSKINPLLDFFFITVGSVASEFIEKISFSKIARNLIGPCDCMECGFFEKLN